MANEMRDRLVELMLDAPQMPCVKNGRATGKRFQTFQNIADHLIENGVVVPVARCCECKYCRKPKGKERYRYFEGVLLCESYEMSDDVCAVNPDDYCSYGERRCSDESRIN
jgi:hypothetical protein